MARTECGKRCTNALFGFILTNQGGHDTAFKSLVASVLLVFIDALVWIKAGKRKAASEER